jgi:hypothetical protein
MIIDLIAQLGLIMCFVTATSLVSQRKKNPTTAWTIDAAQ